MTFGRAFIIALMAAGLAGAANPGDIVITVFIGWLLWKFTTDPLPRAIEEGLDAYRRKHLK